MIETTEQALQIVKNTRLTEVEREDAIRYIETHPSPEATTALIGLLSDPDAGLRWSASEVLERMGEAALPYMLQRLTKPNDAMLRESVQRILKNNTSEKVRNGTHALQAALKGPGADIKSMEVAYETLREWK